jgi:hypothetical protein
MMGKSDRTSAMSERHKGKTPNGGVESIVYYADDQGNPVAKSEATQGEVVELDKDGIELSSTIFRIGS